MLEWLENFLSGARRVAFSLFLGIVLWAVVFATLNQIFGMQASTAAPIAAVFAFVLVVYLEFQHERNKRKKKNGEGVL